METAEKKDFLKGATITVRYDYDTIMEQMEGHGLLHPIRENNVTHVQIKTKTLCYNSAICQNMTKTSFTIGC